MLLFVGDQVFHPSASRSGEELTSQLDFVMTQAKFGQNLGARECEGRSQLLEVSLSFQAPIPRD